MSPSSWLNAHVPISRSVAALVDRHRQGVRAERPARRRTARSRRAASALPGSASGGRSRGRRTSAGTRARFSGDVPAQDDALARQDLRETSVRGPSAARYTIAAMRRWSEVAERVAATTRTSEKTALLADYLRGLDARRAPDRRRLPDRPAVRRGRPARRPASAGRRSRRPSTDLAGVPRSALGEAYDRSSDLGRAVEDVLTLAGHDPDPARCADPPRGRRRLRRDRAGVRARPRKSGDPPRPARPGRSAHRQVPRQGPVGRAPDRAPRGARRGRDREGVRPAARRRQVGRDADRRHRPDGRARPRRPARRRRASPLFHPIKFMLASPAEDAAEIVKRLGVPVWVEDKYDGIRAQLHRAATTSGSTRATSTTSAASSPRSSRVPEACRGTASSTARSSAGGTAPSCRSSRSRRGSGASRRRRRSGPRCR